MIRQKDSFREILKLYGEKYCELSTVLERRENNAQMTIEDFRAMTPTRIFFEPTNNCNLKCSYCARENMSRDISYLTVSDFKRAVASLPRGTQVNMLGNGEPLMNKNIYEMIEFAASSGYIVTLITNGTFLTERNTVELLNSGIHRVQISFDTVDPRVFYDEHPARKDFKKTLYKILRFIHIVRNSRNANIFITISVVMTEGISKTIDKTRNFWDSLPVDNIYEGPLLSLQTDSNKFDQVSTQNVDLSKICANPWTSVKVNADCSVNPCIQDFSSKYIIGDIRENSIAEIINSHKALMLRKALYYGDRKFLHEIGYDCHLCNACTKAVLHDIRGYLSSGFPITYGIIINEISNSGIYPKEKMERLEWIVENFDNFQKGL